MRLGIERTLEMEVSLGGWKESLDGNRYEMEKGSDGRNYSGRRRIKAVKEEFCGRKWQVMYDLKELRYDGNAGNRQRTD